MDSACSKTIRNRAQVRAADLSAIEDWDCG
jgi:hypothetical protein